MPSSMSVSKACVLFLIFVALAGPASSSAFGEVPNQADMIAAWKAMRSEPVDSAEFSQATMRLLHFIEQLSDSQRVEAATVLMDRHASDGVNAAAVELFGSNSLPLESFRRILFDTRRSFAQRVLIRTYFNLLRAEYRTSPLSESTQGQMLQLLTERLAALKGQKVSYGEQRLLTHLCGAMVSGYAQQIETVQQVDYFLDAMGQYASSAPPEDVFGASARGWIELVRNSAEATSSIESAIASLGHWDQLVRWKASRHLALNLHQTEVMFHIRNALADPRDEVRAAAIGIFATFQDVDPTKIVTKLVHTITQERGVMVQAAAAEAIGIRADQAKRAIEPLLSAIDGKNRRRNPGRKRTNSILIALSPLVEHASESQKQRMLKIATDKLSIAPNGALKLLRSLGAYALKSVPDIKTYRSKTGRFMRGYIDRHVLPAIELQSAPS